MNFNKIILGGRLTRDPELRYTPKGTAVCEIGVANETGWGDKKRTHFIDVTFWDKKAETIQQHFQKGDPILIEGEVHMDQWEDKNTGQKRSKLKVQGWSFTFVPTGKREEAQKGLPAGKGSQHIAPPTEGHEDIPF